MAPTKSRCVKFLFEFVFLVVTLTLFAQDLAQISTISPANKSAIASSTPYAGYLRITKMVNNEGKLVTPLPDRNLQPVRFVLNSQEDGTFFLSASKENFLFALGDQVTARLDTAKLKFIKTSTETSAYLKIVLLLADGVIKSGAYTMASTKNQEATEAEIDVKVADPTDVGLFNGMFTPSVSSLRVVSAEGDSAEKAYLANIELKSYSAGFDLGFIQVSDLVGFSWTYNTNRPGALQKTAVQHTLPALLTQSTYIGIGMFMSHARNDSATFIQDDKLWETYGEEDDPFNNKSYRWDFHIEKEIGGEAQVYCRLTIRSEHLAEYPGDKDIIAQVVGEWRANPVIQDFHILEVILDPKEIKAGDFATIKAVVRNQYNQIDENFDGAIQVKILTQKSTEGVARLNADLVSIYKGKSQEIFIFTPKEQFSSSKPITINTILSGVAYFQVTLENSKLAPVEVMLDIYSPFNFLIKDIEIQQGIKNQDREVTLPYEGTAKKVFAPLPFIAGHKTAAKILVGYENTAAIPFSKVEGIAGLTAKLEIYSNSVLRKRYENIKSGNQGIVDYILKDEYTDTEQIQLQDGLFQLIEPVFLPLAGENSFEAELKMPSTLREKDHLDDNKLEKTVSMVATRQLKVMGIKGKFPDTSEPGIPANIWDHLRDVYPVQSTGLIATDPILFRAFEFSRLWVGSFYRTWRYAREILNLHNKENPQNQYDRIVLFGDEDFIETICGENVNGCTYMNEVAILSKTIPSTVAHELGHTYGLKDTYYGTIFKIFSINGYPNPRRTNAIAAGNYIEDGNISLTDVLAAKFSVNDYMDMMGSGGSNRWTDRITWDYLYEKRFKNTSAAALAHKIANTSSYIAVSGTVNINGAASFRSFYTLEKVPEISTSTAGPFTLEFVNAGNAVLQSLSFDLPFAVSEVGEVTEAPFDFYLALPTATTAIVLRKDGAELARRKFSAHAPDVKWLDPKEGDLIRGKRSIRWSARDVDADPLSYDLLYSLDGQAQLPLAVGLTDSTYVWNSKELVGKTVQSLTVIANDGINEGRALVKNLVIAQSDAALPAPSNLKTEAGPGMVFLSWDAPVISPGLSVQGYTIYRSTSPNAGKSGIQVMQLMVMDSLMTNFVFADYGLAANTFFYQITAVYASGESEPSNESSVVLTSVEDKMEESLPKEYRLYQNYPNPFNSQTEIRYDVPVGAQAMNVQMKVYSVTGLWIQTLVDAPMSSGHHRVLWNGKDASALPVPSGVYVFVLQAGSFVQSQKMILIR